MVVKTVLHCWNDRKIGHLGRIQVPKVDMQTRSGDFQQRDKTDLLECSKAKSVKPNVNLIPSKKWNKKLYHDLWLSNKIMLLLGKNQEDLWPGRILRFHTKGMTHKSEKKYELVLIKTWTFALQKLIWRDWGYGVLTGGKYLLITCSYWTRPGICREL